MGLAAGALTMASVVTDVPSLKVNVMGTVCPVVTFGSMSMMWNPPDFSVSTPLAGTGTPAGTGCMVIDPLLMTVSCSSAEAAAVLGTLTDVSVTAVAAVLVTVAKAPVLSGTVGTLT